MQRKLDVRTLCAAAVCTALFAVMDYFSLGIGQTIKITFAGLPILLAAFVLGPIPGAMVGLTGALISQMLRYGFSATTVLWILPAAVRGLLAGWLFIRFGRKKDFFSILWPVLSSSLVVTVLNTGVSYVDSKLYGYYTPGLIVGDLAFRVISSVLTAVVYTVVLIPILKVLPAAKGKNG